MSDFARVEKLSRHVKNMMTAKQPIDCVFAIFNSCKEAFKNLKSSHAYITDHQLINIFET